ncbi:hypothetical protein D9757_008836 [Collybiopsis confluens]|uniref:Tc1-like transposase DDE domain-containing protein n=1 Tax=Collybiopsis confluens TaxID=2823264 RepID=A0A8H5LZR6_9AGAR|nr:hypothetical protein D9757_008836 [Collybiopsis confluens]
MGNRKISRDVKLCAIHLYERDLLNIDNILDCIGFSERTFYRVLKYWRETGDVVPHRYGLRGRPRVLLHDDIQYLIHLVQHRPDYFLDELASLMQDNRFIAVHLSTICRELERLGLSLKRIRRIARERCPLKRANFIAEVGQYSPEQLGFIDETSKDDRTVGRTRGRAKTGLRAMRRQPFVRGKRLTATGLLTLDGMIASTVVEGSMDREKFCTFLEDEVLPLCTPFPGTLSVLVMDNAKIHHGEAVRELIAEHGVRLVYLSPYSPDFNPIEEAFSKVKSFIRRNCDYFYASSYGPGIIYDMTVAMGIITPEDAQGYFKHGGYF